MDIINASFDSLITSLEIAELADKQHGHVVRDIKNQIRSLVIGGLSKFGESNIKETTYKNSQNKVQPCFHITRDGALFVVAGYDAVTRAKIIERCAELEARVQNKEALLEAKASNEIAATMHERDVSLSLDLVKEARFSFGRKAARQMWKFCELPLVPDMLNGDERGEWGTNIESFVRDCLIPSRTFTNASTLYAAYEKWSHKLNLPCETHKTFSLELVSSGIQKRRASNGVIYGAVLKL